MTRLAKVVFALLVIATGGAFFAAQKLKTSAPIVISFRLKLKTISPNGDGRADNQQITFLLKRSEVVDVSVVDQRGDNVRELVSGVQLPAYRMIGPIIWNGRTDDGRIAPDGRYRIAIRLRREGRRIVVPKLFHVDDTPPKVVVNSIGPDASAGPEVLPRRDNQPAQIVNSTAAHDGQLKIFRTWPRPVQLVATVPLKNGSTTGSWDGHGDDGKAVRAGTYLVVAETRDQAGVLGTSVPLDAAGLPRTVYGQPLPGHGGITVRTIAVEPPLLPVEAGAPVGVNVDGSGNRFGWNLSRLNGAAVRHGASAAAEVFVRPPGKASQLYLFTANRGSNRAAAPLAVDDAQSHPVLVVLPLMTWQGLNPVDDNGDGEPNMLPTGGPVKLARVLGTPLPARFGVQERPIMRWLERTHRRYDLTTDYALARGRGPKLAGHSGVLLVGDTVWLPTATAEQLRSFVTKGGTVVEAGTNSLLRAVTLSNAADLTHPLPAATSDIFGSTIAPLRKGTFNLKAGKDQIGLFSGTSGIFTNYDVIEQTEATTGTKPLASATSAEGGVVIVAFALGRGTVIRYGLPQLPSRLASDPDLQGLMESSWRLLSR